jgi:4-alpha-glucanotransferase
LSAALDDHELRRQVLGALIAKNPTERHAEVLVVRRGDTAPIDEVRAVRLEEGGAGKLTPGQRVDLPLGYHEIEGQGRLIVSPGAAHLPRGGRGWGWAAQLYSARSTRSWGIGDLGDLRTLGEWATGSGASLLLVNPLHAPAPGLPQQASPYYPSSRLFRNPLYLRIEDVPGGSQSAEVERLANAGRALNGKRAIDREAVYRLKHDALETVFAAAPPPREFEAFRLAAGQTLEDYATFCALHEARGPWETWPAAYQRPESAGARAFAAANQPRVTFHAWLQWLLDAQLAEAARTVPLMHDLAVGVDPAGADAWLWQDAFAEAGTGAPPDFFNPAGQDWGFRPFHPAALRAAAYEPYIQTLRANFRHGAALRVDHVMGLFRLWWVPPGFGPEAGAYVRYEADELLDILALESVRARAVVVGEDLGTVDHTVREELARRNVLSYRLLWFEPGPPAGYPEQALAAVTTHDLPTVAGLWSGTDVAEQRALGLDANEEASGQLRRRLQGLTGAGDGDALDEVVGRTYEALASAPSMLLTATLEDAMLAHERPNLPGTNVARNWSVALPHPIETLDKSPVAQRIATALRRDRA